MKSPSDNYTIVYKIWLKEVNLCQSKKATLISQLKMVATMLKTTHGGKNLLQKNPNAW